MSVADSSPGKAVAASAKAKVWRDRAARYRALARASFNSDARTTFLKLAEDCERYADKAEGQTNFE